MRLDKARTTTQRYRKLLAKGDFEAARVVLDDVGREVDRLDGMLAQLRTQHEILVDELGAAIKATTNKEQIQ